MATTTPSRVYSKTFFASGVGNGTDQTLLSVVPWESSATTIIGVEVVAYSGNAPASMWITNSSNNFGYLGIVGNSARHLKTMYAAGQGAPFPAASKSPTAPRLDLHVTVSSGAFALFFVLYYTIP
jgi:hypothetical protein